MNMLMESKVGLIALLVVDDETEMILHASGAIEELFRTSAESLLRSPLASILPFERERGMSAGVMVQRLGNPMLHIADRADMIPRLLDVHIFPSEWNGDSALIIHVIERSDSWDCPDPNPRFDALRACKDSVAIRLSEALHQTRVSLRIAERKLMETSARLQCLLDAFPGALIEFRDSGVIVNGNRILVEMLGFESFQSLVGASLFDHIDPISLNLVTGILRENRTDTRMVQFIRADGERFLAQMTFCAVKPEDTQTRYPLHRATIHIESSFIQNSKASVGVRHDEEERVPCAVDTNRRSEIRVGRLPIEISEGVSDSMECTHVLLIDDDLDVLMLLKRMLTRLGMEVMAFSDPAEALSVCSSRIQSFSVVITDEMMPRINGWELARRVHDISRKIPIVMLTGRKAAIDPSQIAEHRIAACLAKPIRLHDLAHAIQSVMDAALGDAGLSAPEFPVVRVENQFSNEGG